MADLVLADLSIVQIQAVRDAVMLQKEVSLEVYYAARGILHKHTMLALTPVW